MGQMGHFSVLTESQLCYDTYNRLSLYLSLCVCVCVFVCVSVFGYEQVPTLTHSDVNRLALCEVCTPPGYGSCRGSQPPGLVGLGPVVVVAVPGGVLPFLTLCPSSLGSLGCGSSPPRFLLGCLGARRQRTRRGTSHIHPSFWSESGPDKRFKYDCVL